MKSKEKKIKDFSILVNKIFNSDESLFYKNIWKDVSTPVSIDTIPIIDHLSFIKTPLHDRQYKQEKGITKIVKKYETPFLVNTALVDLKEEDFGDKTVERPLVLLSDSHEALEKSMWFYENNTLPLIGETKNLKVTAYAASRYKIDSIVIDMKMFSQFLPPFSTKYNIKDSIKITVLDDNFDKKEISSILKLFPSARFILCLPETGAFANSCSKSLAKGNLIFHENNTSIVEVADTLIVSRLRNLVTPIIRYNSNIRGEFLKQKSCTCAYESFTLVQNT